MLRVLIIECLLFGLLGGVVFRVVFALVHRTWMTWSVNLLLIALISSLISGRFDPRMIHDLGGPDLPDVSPALFIAARIAAWLLGSGFAWMVLRYRAARGLQIPDNLPPEDR